MSTREYNVPATAFVSVDDDGLPLVTVYLEDLTMELEEVGATAADIARVDAAQDRFGTSHPVIHTKVTPLLYPDLVIPE